ncbi:MAG: SAM-dependent methyltransferase, partial [Propionibacterium sp.]
MNDYLLLRSPSSNRVYNDSAAELAAGELAICAPFANNVYQTNIAGVGYLAFTSGNIDTALLASQSSALALFEKIGDLLAPIALPEINIFSEDLVTIPKYQGKTNEQFTRLLLNVTLSVVDSKPNGNRQILDPLSGRGTTLSTAWLAGHDSFGIEADEKSFEAMAAFIKTWLRRKRLKHQAKITPVRRNGKLIGKRFDAEVKTDGNDFLMTVFTGDTRDSAELFGKKKFDAIITDAP